MAEYSDVKLVVEAVSMPRPEYRERPWSRDPDGKGGRFPRGSEEIYRFGREV